MAPEMSGLKSPKRSERAARVEVTGRELDLRRPAVEVVAVDIDVVEPVEGPDLLQLLVRLLQDVGVPEPDVPDCLRVGCQVAGGEIGVVVEAVHLDAAQV